MTTLTVTIPNDAKAKLSNFVKELGGEIIPKNKKATAKALTKKAKLLNEIQMGLREVKAVQEGKLQPLYLDDLLDGK